MESERFLKDCTASSRTVSSSRTPEVGEEGPLKVRNRILSKIAKRLGELGNGNSEPEPDFYFEMKPDVIIIPDDQSLLFEAQNAHALEVLSRVCGMAPETMALYEPVRVHPCRSSQIIDKLKAAGASVI